MNHLRICFPPSAEILIEAFHRYMLSVEQFEPELLPTRQNAERFAAVNLIPALDRQDPILIALDDTTVVGATFTTLSPEGLQYRIPTAYGHGTWVREDYRHKGVARALIDAVRAILRRHGIKRQIGLAHGDNPDSLIAFQKLGFVPHGTVLRYDL